MNNFYVMDYEVPSDALRIDFYLHYPNLLIVQSSLVGDGKEHLSVAQSAYRATRKREKLGHLKFIILNKRWLQLL